MFDSFAPFLPVIILALVSLIIATILIQREKKQAKQWEEIAEGVCDKVSWEEVSCTRRSGAMTHSTSHYSYSKVTIYFEDGGVITVKDVELPAVGTFIKVFVNPLGDFKVEAV